MNRVYRVVLIALLISFAAEIGRTQSYPVPPAPEPGGPSHNRLAMQNKSEEQKRGNPDVQLIVNPEEVKRQRYLELKKETNELARMAAELKLAVEQSNPQVLSLEAARKADQVEKLSKRIRDRIKHGH